MKFCPKITFFFLLFIFLSFSENIGGENSTRFLPPSISHPSFNFSQRFDDPRNFFESESLNYDGINFVSPFEQRLQKCDDLLKFFTSVAENFTECITSNSLPPFVCTRCVDYFVHLNNAYFTLKDSIECSQAIFGTYATVYVEDIFQALSGNIWTESRCTDCLEFIISPQFTSTSDLLLSTPNYRYNNKTAKFFKFYSQLYDCVRSAGGNITGLDPKNSSVVCGECWTDYQSLSLYYEESILSKEDFCADVESAINDTIRYWRNEIKCNLPALPAKSSEAVFVALISLAMFALTVLFYSGSYMQGSRRKRRLKKYRSLYTYRSTGASINNDIIHDFIHERERERERRRQPSEVSLITGGTPGERTPLFAGGRRVISYSQLPPSNLG